MPQVIRTRAEQLGPDQAAGASVAMQYREPLRPAVYFGPTLIPVIGFADDDAISVGPPDRRHRRIGEHDGERNAPPGRLRVGMARSVHTGDRAFGRRLVEHRSIHVRVAGDIDGAVATAHRFAIEDRHTVIIELQGGLLKVETLQRGRPTGRDDHAIEPGLPERSSGPDEFCIATPHASVDLDAEMDVDLAAEQGLQPIRDHGAFGAAHAFGIVEQGHWKTTTFTGALRLSGMTAPMVLDEPMTGECFVAYVAQILVPTLRPGDVMILDNLPAHKSVTAREAIEATGAQMLFLPPYSPDFNPIENAFSKLKAILRKAAARTIHDLWNAIRDALPCFTPDECANYFSATGYEPE